MFFRLLLISILLYSALYCRAEMSPMDDTVFGQERSGLETRSGPMISYGFVSMPFFDKKLMNDINAGWRTSLLAWKILPWLKSVQAETTMNLLMSPISTKNYQVIFFSPISASVRFSFRLKKYPDSDFFPFAKIGLGYTAIAVINDKANTNKESLNNSLFFKSAFGGDYYYFSDRAALTVEFYWRFEQLYRSYKFYTAHFAGLNIGLSFLAASMREVR